MNYSTIQRVDDDDLLLDDDGNVLNHIGERLFYLPPAVLEKLPAHDRHLLAAHVAAVQKREFYRGVQIGRSELGHDLRRLLNAAPLEPTS